MRTPGSSILLLLLALPTTAPALPPPVGFSLEAAASGASSGAAARLTAVTSCWIEGDVEAEARLGFGSADRPGGRRADAVTPALGLRWGPDVGRLRPLLGLEAGVRLPTAGRGVAPTAAARAGLELWARRRLALSVAVGWRWSPGVGSGAEACVGLGYHP
jgi:hypothetical protein